MSKEDLELVRRVLADEPAPLKQLSARVQRVARGCLRALAARAPAVRGHEDDLAQQLLVMLLENDKRALQTYGGRASLDTWLDIVAKRFFIRRIQRLAKEQPAEDERFAMLESSGDSPEKQHQRREETNAIRIVVRELGDEDQLLLALLYEQDAPAHEVARVLGLTPSGVRMRKARLLRKLAERLRALLEEGAA